LKIKKPSAMKLAPIGLAIAVFRSSTVLTTIIGGKIYKEKGVLRKLLAALIVIGGVILIAL
jgi:multidrug transporter EmrE-like cation transporter